MGNHLENRCGLGDIQGVRLHRISLLLAACLGAVTACSTIGPAHPNRTNESWQPASVTARASRSFTKAVLLKPVAMAGETLAASLAPLLVQEVAEAVLTSSLIPPTPLIYSLEETVHLGERSYLQVSYLWNSATNTASLGSPAQGIRMTLNAAGAPVLWELLSEGLLRRVFFVAESLEEAARAEHGAPLQGREYAIEPDAGALPKVQIVRLLQDGPIPMGPMIYLGATNGLVTTILCRCMPAQVERIVETGTYHLLPLPDTSDLSGRGEAEAERGIVRLRQLARPPADRDELDRCLRLPKQF